MAMGKSLAAHYFRFAADQMDADAQGNWRWFLKQGGDSHNSQ
jgi:TPR repeat protein